MFSEQEIRGLIRKNKTLAVYQLAILDFLNSAENAEDIAGIPSAPGPISDDPKRRGTGYDIGPTVARRILDRREELGGSFTSLEQLAGIPYLGEDKMHDIIYTFLTLKAPVPTGLGAEFDNFIMALGRLEVSALRDGYSPEKTLSSVRKLFFNKEIPKIREDEQTKMDWDKIVPKNKRLVQPAKWAVHKGLIDAAGFVEQNATIQIGSEQINIHTLIAALDARSHPDSVVTGSDKLILGSNMDVAGTLLRLAAITYAYLSPFSISAGQQFRIQEKDLVELYENSITHAELAALGDAYTMKFNPDRSLSWNLLNYYTNEKELIKTRFQKLAESLELGKLDDDGRFSNDNLDTRAGILENLRSTSFMLLKENRRTRFINRMIAGGRNDGGFLAYDVVSTLIMDRFIDRLRMLNSYELHKSAIISWNRLEARPRKEDFSRTLRAEVRDALWFISRQWQFGEFKAEDAGSAMEMRVDMQTSKIERFSLKGSQAKEYKESVPMETTIEREKVHLDLTLRQEMGRYFEKLLQEKLSETPNAFSQATIDDVISDFRSEPSFQFTLPEPEPENEFPELYSNPDLVKHYAAIKEGRRLDGGAVYKSIKDGTSASSFVSSTSNVNALARINIAGQALLNWFERVYNQPQSENDSAWNAQQLEYQFQCAIPSSGRSRSILSTTEYANGHLDWYNFDIEKNSSNYPTSLATGVVERDNIKRKQITVLPSDLKYPGMPLPRWWQFEDFKVNLGDLKANTNELPKILMTEFALIYSNDWMLMPFDVETGSLCDIKSVVVRDIFGQHTRVVAAGSGDNSDWKRWTMFNLYRKDFTHGVADTRLFVPPAVVRTMESEPIESVCLMRDEMSNLVWGIEKTISDGLGGPMDGKQAARRLYEYLVSKTPETEEESLTLENAAEIKYSLGTSVPEHWIPFIPVRKDAVMSRQIQLRRAAMPRIIKGRTPERVRPRSELIRTGYNPDTQEWSPYFLHEEEVPRSGVIVNRSWQRTRWMNGKNYTWLGRRVKNGRGEANSGLEYDQVKTK